jgi:hypothetical protein
MTKKKTPHSKTTSETTFDVHGVKRQNNPTLLLHHQAPYPSQYLLIYLAYFHHAAHKPYSLHVHATQSQKGVCHSVALPFTLRSILGQKKNYENSNISHHAKI